MHRWHFVLRAVMMIAAIGCAPYLRTANGYEYTVPNATNDGLEVASLDGEKIDADLIKSLFDEVLSGRFKNVSSVLVAKDGKLIIEEYFPRQEGDRRAHAFRQVAPQEITSATKSVTSILVGIAIDQQLIRNVDEKVSTFFPEYADLFADDDRAKLSLRHLLAMSAGLSWDEWTTPYNDPRNDHIRMLRSDDPIRYVLEQPMASQPGTKFTYSSGVSLLLGEIIRKATNMPADRFAKRNLFEPLGISDFYWSKYPGELVQTGGGLFLRPRDMTKIGYLFLNKGRWQGKQVVSEGWVKQSTENYVAPGQIQPAVSADGYGFHWWLTSLQTGNKAVDTYSARGRGGQFILVVPSLKLVAVFTSPTDNPLTFQPLEMTQQYILPADSILSSTSGPNDSP
jgi:CubicO group peptidase (beta-lactamase class C family)